MADVVTEKFEELVLETSEDGTTWTRIAGLIDVEVTRTSNIDTAEVPDASDESLPLSLQKQVRSIEISVSATGVWAQSVHGTLMDWFYSSATKQTRIGNLKATTGDTEYETGNALLANLSNSRTKGQKVTANVEIQFDGTPTRTAKV